MSEARIAFVTAALRAPSLEASLTELHQLLIDMLDVHEQQPSEEPILAALTAFENQYHYLQDLTEIRNSEGHE